MRCQHCEEEIERRVGVWVHPRTGWTSCLDPARVPYVLRDEHGQPRRAEP